MTWIYVAAAVVAVVLAGLVFILFPRSLDVEMPGGESDMMQFQPQQKPRREARRRWRITIERG